MTSPSRTVVSSAAVGAAGDWASAGTDPADTPIPAAIHRASTAPTRCNSALPRSRVILRVGATGDEPGKPTAAARPRTHLPPAHRCTLAKNPQGCQTQVSTVPLTCCLHGSCTAITPHTDPHFSPTSCFWQELTGNPAQPASRVTVTQDRGSREPAADGCRECRGKRRTVPL